MIKRILLTTAFAATLFTSPINAGDIDCDAMVNECIANNPYMLILTPRLHIGYNAGCAEAGDVCRNMI